MEGDESFQEDYVIWETLNVDNVAAEEEVANFSESSNCGITYNLDDSSQPVTDCFSLGLEDGLQPVEYSDNQLQSFPYSQSLLQSTGDKYSSLPTSSVNNEDILNSNNSYKLILPPEGSIDNTEVAKEVCANDLTAVQNVPTKNDLVSIRTPTGASCMLPVVTVMPVLKLQDGSIKQCAPLLNVSSFKSDLVRNSTASSINKCTPLLSSVKINSAKLLTNNPANGSEKSSPLLDASLKSNSAKLLTNNAALLNVSSLKSNSDILVMNNAAKGIKNCAPLFDISSFKSNPAGLVMKNTATGSKNCVLLPNASSSKSNNSAIVVKSTSTTRTQCAPLVNVSSLKSNSAQLPITNTANTLTNFSKSLAVSPAKSNSSQFVIKNSAKSLNQNKNCKYIRKISEKKETFLETKSCIVSVETNKDHTANNEELLPRKVATVRIVNIEKNKDTKNLQSFEKLKNVEMVHKFNSEKSKVFVLEKGKLVEKKHVVGTNNTTLLQTNIMNENLVTKQMCSRGDVVLPSKNLIIHAGTKLQNPLIIGAEQQDVSDITETVSFLNPSISNKSNSYSLMQNTVTNPSVSQRNILKSSDGNFKIKSFPLNHDNITLDNSMSSTKSTEENDALQNVKLLLSKSELISSNIDTEFKNTKLDETSASDCTEVIFTSENAQSNDDFGHLNSEDFTNSKDMGSVFEVNVNASTVLNTFDIPTTSQKLLPGNIIQVSDSSQLTNPISCAILQRMNNDDSSKTIISNMSTTMSTLDDLQTLDTNNVVINSSVNESLSCGEGNDVKIVKTKGQFYIQHKQKHNDEYVIVLTPLTREMMMPVLPMNRSDCNEITAAETLDTEPDDLLYTESIVRTTPATTETEAEKRERVRLAKRVLRTDPHYRARESAKARIRMQKVRTSERYREKEREKDRKRRAKSRKENTLLRTQEKERDKAYQYYKRLQRDIHGAVMPVFLEEEVSCEINEDVVVTVTVGMETDDTESSLSL